MGGNAKQAFFHNAFFGPLTSIPTVEALRLLKEFVQSVVCQAVESLGYECGAYLRIDLTTVVLGDSLEPFHPAAQDVRSAVLLRKLGCVGTGCTAILE